MKTGGGSTGTMLSSCHGRQCCQRLSHCSSALLGRSKLQIAEYCCTMTSARQCTQKVAAPWATFHPRRYRVRGVGRVVAPCIILVRSPNRTSWAVSSHEVSLPWSRNRNLKLVACGSSTTSKRFHSFEPSYCVKTHRYRRGPQRCKRSSLRATSRTVSPTDTRTAVLRGKSLEEDINQENSLLGSLLSSSQTNKVE